MLRLSAAMTMLVFASGASAQQGMSKLPTVGQTTTKQTTATATNGASGSSPAQATMADLLGKGYEIKAAVPNGGKFIVFMQKDQSAYACEFQSLTGARCGSIN
jgi:hypothetical protein